MFDINDRAHNFIKKQLEAGAKTTDQNRPIGSKAVLNNQDVYWSGENYGWQSAASFEKLKNSPEFRAGHITLSRLGTDIQQGVNHVVEHTPDSIKQPVLAAARAINQGWKSLPSEVRGAVNSTLDFAGDVNKAVSKTTNVSPIITGEVLTAGAGKAVSLGSKAAVKAQIPSRIYEAQRDFRGMGAVPLGTPGSVGAASAMKPAKWSSAVKALDGDTVAIQNLLSRPYHKSIKGTRFEHMTLEDLSNNKGGWLDTLAERDANFSSNHANYMKTKSSAKQRKMYDEFTDNPLSASRQVYDDNLIRKAITKSFNQVTGKEWHHVFGNKEAAETMLTTIAQDPYIAVNLFHHMQKIKLPISGKADNIALMGKASHRKTGGLHSYQKKLGLENTGRKKGDLELNHFAEAISDSVLKGDADVTELFTLIETYAKLNKEHLRPMIQNKFGGKMLNELEGMEAFIQGQ